MKVAVFLLLYTFYGLLNGLKTSNFTNTSIPIVIQTWPWPQATDKAWSVLSGGGNAVDSVEAGCHVCETTPCGTSVGYGGSPDEKGETRLDAMIMDGLTHNIGAVGSMGRVKNAIGVARAVMEYTEHTLLVGDRATDFAREMGFPIENLSTEASVQQWQKWKGNHCQPNYRKNVSPDPTSHCGPYKRNNIGNARTSQTSQNVITTPTTSQNVIGHDTLGMIAIDNKGGVACGMTTNGATFKIPGRVGDSPIPGSGCYISNDIGGAAGTGDGDILMRFLPTYHAVDEMRRGRSPSEAAQLALQPITKFYPHYSGAVIAVNTRGEYGAACVGFKVFQFCVRHVKMNQVDIITLKCS